MDLNLRSAFSIGMFLSILTWAKINPYPARQTENISGDVKLLVYTRGILLNVVNLQIIIFFNAARCKLEQVF